MEKAKLAGRLVEFEAEHGINTRGALCDTALHVTAAPTEAVISKCCENLKPLIITAQSGAGGAAALAKSADVDDRIDILEVEQLAATNVCEWSKFEHTQRLLTVRELVETDNRIIEEPETDPSLKVSVG